MLSVAHLSLLAALVLKADPIIFVGQDLAYTSERHDHASDTVVKSSVPQNESLIRARGLNGEYVLTSHQFLDFRTIFENIIAQHTDTTFFNASAAGLDIAGAAPVPLCNILEALPVLSGFEKVVNERQLKHALNTAKLKAVLSRISGRLERVSKNIRRASRFRADILKFIKGNNGKASRLSGSEGLPGRLQKTLRKLDNVNEKIDRETTVWNVLFELTLPASEDSLRLQSACRLKQQYSVYGEWLNLEFEKQEFIADIRLRSVIEAARQIRDVLGFVENKERLLKQIRRGDCENVCKLMDFYINKTNLVQKIFYEFFKFLRRLQFFI